MPPDAVFDDVKLFGAAEPDAAQTALVRRWSGAPPLAPIRGRLQLFQIWIGFFHAALAAIVLVVPLFNLISSTFIICAIMLVAALFKLLLASAHHGPIGTGYAISGLQAVVGSGAIIVLPVLSIASPATVLAIYFALEAAATAYLAGVVRTHRSAWLAHAGVSAALCLVALFWLQSMPFWAFGLLISIDLAAAGASYTRAGLAAIAEGEDGAGASSA